MDLRNTQSFSFWRTLGSGVPVPEMGVNCPKATGRPPLQKWRLWSEGTRKGPNPKSLKSSREKRGKRKLKPTKSSLGEAGRMETG